MTVKIDGTNTVANPAFTGADTDTGLQCGTNEVKLVTGGTAQATVDSSGKFGIGTTSPSSKLHVIGDDGNFINLAHASRSGSWLIEHSGTNSENLDFRQNNGSTTVRSYLAGRDLHAFYTNGSERVRILSTGGITFNGDTAQTNALDDYEEGTWTPTPYLSYNPSGRGLAASGEAGRYTKIGQIVHCWFGFNYSINGSGTFNLGINNLPFTVKSNAGFAYNGGGAAREAAYTGYMFFAESCIAGTTQLGVLRRYDNGSPRDPSGTMVGHVTYEAA